MSDLLDRRWLVLGVSILTCAFALLFVWLVPPSSARPLLAEGGPVETASVVLHLVVAAGAVWVLLKGHRLAGLLGLAELMMALREVDAHKAFTTFGVFSTKLYARPEVPMTEKVLAGLSVLALLAALGWALWAARAELRALIANRSPAFYGLVTLVPVLIVLKQIDGLPRMLRSAGVAVSEASVDVAHAIEEWGELGLPILTTLILIQLMRERRAGA